MLPLISADSRTLTDLAPCRSPSTVPSTTMYSAEVSAFTWPFSPMVRLDVCRIVPSTLPWINRSSSADSSPLNFSVGPRTEALGFLALSYGLLIASSLNAELKQTISNA